MISDICNSAIVGNPARLLSTKEVVTSKDCWMLYLNGLIARPSLGRSGYPGVTAGARGAGGMQ